MPKLQVPFEHIPNDSAHRLMLSAHNVLEPVPQFGSQIDLSSNGRHTAQNTAVRIYGQFRQDPMLVGEVVAFYFLTYSTRVAGCPTQPATR